MLSLLTASSRWERPMLHLHRIPVWNNRAAVAWPSLGPTCKYLSFPASWRALLSLLWKTTLLLSSFFPPWWGEGFVVWWVCKSRWVHPDVMLLYNCGNWLEMGLIWREFCILLHILDWFVCLFIHVQTHSVTLGNTRQLIDTTVIYHNQIWTFSLFLENYTKNLKALHLPSMWLIWLTWFESLCFYHCVINL